MKTVIAIVAAALLCGCGKEQATRQKLAAQTQALLMTAITNETVGLTRIIETHIEDWDTNGVTYDNPTNWTASATVEFVNTNGGIERKEIPFIFQNLNYGGSLTQNFLACIPDVQKIAAADEKRYQEELKNIGK